jgi:hypothetical protein
MTRPAAAVSLVAAAAIPWAKPAAARSPHPVRCAHTASRRCAVRVLKRYLITTYGNPHDRVTATCRRRSRDRFRCHWHLGTSPVDITGAAIATLHPDGWDIQLYD